MFHAGRPRLVAVVALFAACASQASPTLAQVQVTYTPTVLIGGSGRDFVHGLARDPAGNIYLVGETDSGDFPIVGGVQSTRKGLTDAFVMKLDPSGTVIYSTYLGGSFTETAFGIAADPDGNAYVTGVTSSTDFPRVQALDTTRSGSSDAFIVKLGPAGNTILFSTYFGGDSFDTGTSIALDPQRNVYIAGRTLGGLPVANAAQGAYGGNEDGFVAKLNASLTAYDYVTYVGGSQVDIVRAIDVDGDGRACIAGETESTDLAVVNGSQTSPGAGRDAIYAVLSPAGSAFDVLSYLGGSGADTAASVACSTSRLVVGGQTLSLDFPTGPPGHPEVQAQPADLDPSGTRAFVTALVRPLTAIEYSSYVDGRRDESAALVGLRGENVVAVVSTNSAALPVTDPPTRLSGAGVYTSNDGGATWAPGGLEGTRVNQVASYTEGGTTKAVAATDVGVHTRGSDGGWTKLTHPLAQRVTHAIVVDPLDPCTWTVGVDAVPADGPTPVGAARTPDCGKSWINLFVDSDAFRIDGVKTLNYLFGEGRILATRKGPGGSDTCVLNAADGAILGCLARGGSDQLIAVAPSNPCVWYEANIGGSPNVARGFSLSPTCDGDFRTGNLPFAGFTHLVSSLLVLPGSATDSAPTVVAASGKDVWTRRDGPGGAWEKRLTLGAGIGGLGFDPAGDIAITFGTRYQHCARDFSSCSTPVETGARLRTPYDIGFGRLLALEQPGPDLYTRTSPANGGAPTSSYQGSAQRDEEPKAFAIGLGPAAFIFALQLRGPSVRLPGEASIGPGGQEDIALARLSDDAVPPCVTLSFTTIDVGPGDNGTIFLDFDAAGCGDVGIVVPAWLTVLSQGDGFAIFGVQPNPGASRTGIVQVGDAQLTVSQRGMPPPGTAFGVQTTSTFDAEGGIDALIMEGQPGDHRIVVSQGAEWLLDGGGAGGNYFLVAEPNAGPERTATVEIRNPATNTLLQTLTYTQAAAAANCGNIDLTSVDLSSNGLPYVSIGNRGGERSVGVVASPGCVHESDESVPWIGGPVYALGFPRTPERHSRAPLGGLRRAAPLTGTGSGVVSFRVAPNLGPGRAATVTVAGHPVVVVQGAHPDAVISRANLSEGATSEFFDTQIALANPSRERAVVATARFDTAQGASHERSLLLLPFTSDTIDAKAIPGLEVAEFSTSLSADGPVVAARLMSWDATGYGSHGESGIPAPATTWYLAEGATHSGFDLFYLFHNPGTTPASVTVRYLRPEPLVPLEKQYVVPPATRLNAWVDFEDPGLSSTDVSAVITSSVPIVVERAMYLSNQGRFFNAGHESAGVTSPATDWYFAEGATGDYFDLFLLLANPGDSPVTVTATYLLSDGATILRTYVVAPSSRQTVWVDYEAPELTSTAVSMRLTASAPFLAERAMWWPGPPSSWHESHGSAGATVTATRWALAAGEQGSEARHETYVLIANLSPFEGAARVTLLFEGSTPPAVTTVALPPTSRTNVPVGIVFPSAAGRRFGVLVESLGASPAQLVVEQATYSDSGGVRWAAGASMLGTPLPEP